MAEALLHKYDRQHALEVAFDEFGSRKRPPTARTLANYLTKELVTWGDLRGDDDGLVGAAVAAVRKVADRDRVGRLVLEGYLRMAPAVLRRAAAIWDDPYAPPEF